MKIEYSKSLADRSKKIDSNIAEAFRQFKEKKAQEERMLKEQHDNKMYSTAYASYSAKHDRIREKEKVLTESLEYDEKTNVIGLTKILTQVVKESLLLDLDEYKAINEHYEEFISDTVKSFLEHANINQDIENEDTKKLLEFVETNKPVKEAGIYLTEEQIADEFSQEKFDQIEDSIDSLAGDTMDRVAELIDHEREQSQEINDNLNAITGLEESERPLLIKNDNRKSVLEVLALNEATEMIAKGQPYNSDLALANAITYITVLEALDNSGLVTVGEKGYKKILEAAGETVTPLRKLAAKSSPVLIETANKEIPSKVKSYQDKINEAKTIGFTSFADWKKEKNKFMTNENTTIQENVQYEYKNSKGEGFTKDQVKDILIREGFDFEVDDFATIARSMGYRKI